jgi:hypothetical protein
VRTEIDTLPRITVATVAISLPVLLSSLRFFPGASRSHAVSYLKSLIIHPATFGRHHRAPVAGAIVPTRGQTLYIAFISFLNIILLLAPYTITQPQASFTSLSKQTLSIVGNRAGVMAMGNVVALFVFASRNSPLLFLTDWSYGTYLLLHRWLGYWAVMHTVIHSCMLWSYYVKAGTYAAEFARLYWTWGIVGTVAACALIPFSLATVRRKFYEFFVIAHVALSLLFLVGYYYHIWYVYTYNWGYEIWMFVAAGIWALERLIRVARMAVQGSCTAVITVVPNTDGEYLRIVVERKDLEPGVAFLCFPTLRWQFWETHPFSVSGAIEGDGCSSQNIAQVQSSSRSRSSSGPDGIREKRPMEHTTAAISTDDAERLTQHHNAVFFARARTGVTKALAAKVAASEGYSIRLRVLIDGPYDHSGRIDQQLARCDSILCIAGGVGITAFLPILKQNNTKECKLCWSSRKSGLVAEVDHTLRTLPSNVKVETLVGRRLDLDSILSENMVEHHGTTKGPLAIIVSGPPGLADDVRSKVTQIARHSRWSRAYILVDEAFSW